MKILKRYKNENATSINETKQRTKKSERFVLCVNTVRHLLDIVQKHDTYVPTYVNPPELTNNKCKKLKYY